MSCGGGGGVGGGGGGGCPLSISNNDCRTVNNSNVYLFSLLILDSLAAIITCALACTPNRSIAQRFVNTTGEWHTEINVIRQHKDWTFEHTTQSSDRQSPSRLN